MKYYYDVALHEVGGDVVFDMEVPTKKQALAQCKKIAKEYPNLVFDTKHYYIQVQKIDNDEWSSDYMCWVDFWEYNPYTMKLED